jgi:hypothetical protein
VLFTVEIEGVKLAGSADSEVSVITKAEEGQHFVSIDGKRTYINLFGSSTEQGGVTPTRIQQGGHTLPPQNSASTIGTGYVIEFTICWPHTERVKGCSAFHLQVIKMQIVLSSNLYYYVIIITASYYTLQGNTIYKIAPSACQIIFTSKFWLYLISYVA